MRTRDVAKPLSGGVTAKPIVAAAAAAAPSGRPTKPRRLRNVTYVRTQQIEAPILKILASGRYTVDIPRYQRMMGDEAVFVLQITSLGGGDLGIDLGPAGWNWLVRHKYSSFANLHMILKSMHIIKDMPKFPRKGLVLYTTNALLEKRRQKLSAYISALSKTDIGKVI